MSYVEMWFRHISDNAIEKTMYLVSFRINIGLDLSKPTINMLIGDHCFKNDQKSAVVLLRSNLLKILIFYAFFCNM